MPSRTGPSKPAQLSLFKPRLEHGGGLRARKRKLERPIDPKRPLHLTLHSSRARRAWSLLNPRHRFWIEDQAHATGKKHGVKVYRFANVGNHLHLLVKTPTRAAFQAFLREISGRIAMRVTEARKGNPVGRFWDELAYSRVVSWGRDFENVTRYFIKNLFESIGAIGPREKAMGLKVITLTADRGPPG